MTDALPPLLAQREFRALLGARLTNSLATGALATVVAFQTYEITGDPLPLGLLGLVEAIPAPSIMLSGGHGIGASNELGAFESGVAARIFGAVPSVVAGGVLTLGIVGVVALSVPGLRRLDLDRAEPPASPWDHPAGVVAMTAGGVRLDP